MRRIMGPRVRVNPVRRHVIGTVGNPRQLLYPVMVSCSAVQHHYEAIALNAYGLNKPWRCTCGY